MTLAEQILHTYNTIINNPDKHTEREVVMAGRDKKRFIEAGEALEKNRKYLKALEIENAKEIKKEIETKKRVKKEERDYKPNTELPAKTGITTGYLGHEVTIPYSEVTEEMEDEWTEQGFEAGKNGSSRILRSLVNH